MNNIGSSVPRGKEILKGDLQRKGEVVALHFGANFEATKQLQFNALDFSLSFVFLLNVANGILLLVILYVNV